MYTLFIGDNFFHYRSVVFLVIENIAFCDLQVRRGYYYGDGPCYCMSAPLMDAGEKYYRLIVRVAPIFGSAI